MKPKQNQTDRIIIERAGRACGPLQPISRTWQCSTNIHTACIKHHHQKHAWPSAYPGGTAPPLPLQTKAPPVHPAVLPGTPAKPPPAAAPLPQRTQCSVASAVARPQRLSASPGPPAAAAPTAALAPAAASVPCGSGGPGSRAASRTSPPLACCRGSESCAARPRLRRATITAAVDLRAW